MIGSVLNIFRVPELRRKVLVTCGLLAVYRIGAYVPTPFIDPAQMNAHFQNAYGGSSVFGVIDMFSGGAFRQMTIFALGIMPYISASIILQLLTAVWPKLEKISKEGEAGRKKITQWTRYGTVALSLFQGLGIGIWLARENLSLIPRHPLLFLVTTAMTMSTGTCFIMWLGEKITEHGIGNGISIIIAAGIMARYPSDLHIGYMSVQSQSMSPFAFGMVFVLCILMSALIVISQQATRKVPVQHARRMVGRRVMQGASTYVPLKLNTANVIPVIFAAAILTFPGMLLPYISGPNNPNSIGNAIASWLQINSVHNLYDGLGISSGGIFNVLKAFNLYSILYVVLTVVFCYYYTAITLNPADLADNLKKSGAFVPGIKPGKNTADYIDHILVRITTVGAIILVVIAMMPEILYVSFGINYTFAQIAGGTGLIIVVGVVLDTMKQIESQLMMRHYEGFGGRSGATASSRVRLRPRRIGG